MRRRIERVRESLRRRGDSGIVAVWVALLFPVLFMMCAFAVDVARWYVEGELQQKAADSAALAGVPYKLTDFAQAQSTAFNYAKINGYTHAPPTTTVIVSKGARDSQLKVTITRTIKNNFAAFMGFKTQTITRVGTADYTGPAPVGSPCNSFGNEPSGSTASPSGVGPVTALPTGSNAYASCKDSAGNPLRNPFFWATAAGPYVYKTQGDRFGTKYCSGTESGCLSGTPPPNCAYNDVTTPLTNPIECKDEAGERGYVFNVQVRNPSTTGSVTVQLYDPAYVDTGSSCENIPAGATGVTNAYTNDAANRYRANPTPISASVPSFCTGDNDNQSLSYASNLTVNDTSTEEIPTITSFGMINPTDTFNPFDLTANLPANRTPGCSRQFDGYRYDGGKWVGSTGQPAGANGTAQLGQNTALTQNFHQWVTLCTFNPSAYVSAGTTVANFYLRVRTNVALGNDMFSQLGGDANVKGNGSNRYAIRAFPTTNLATNAKNVSVSANERMPIFVNGKDTSSPFNLIRVTPGSAGGSLFYSFYDVGDASGGNGATVQVVRPPDASGSNLTGCTSTPGGKLPSGQALPSCQISNITNGGGWNGQWQEIKVPIPADYNCDYTNPGGCWFGIKVTFGGNATVTDQTTWTAYLDGDPVRLVK